ncbi:NlpC/P60 family protein [Streptomyces sp. DSM 44938]|uniref:NlpC/P60 family protein n=1 Tax=Streptomyces litchfieldiae TaxID=3075543 RepID=A0ABU2MY33_9ACTN|nr:NlpC/P60 family protein [Streptomyces sp. DSM 44938]MDT0346567.1 NlpC/P60 family protein [Streptomyces sp. DSM 44938]
MLSAAATAAAVMGAVPVLAVPGEPPADSAAAAREVDRLFADAERAIEAYNGTAERVEELRAEFERRRGRVTRGQEAVNEQRRALGSAAAAQYRSGGFDPTVTLMFSDSPEAYLARAAVLERLGARRAGELRELVAAQRTLERRRAEAADKLGELTAEQERLADRKHAAQTKLAAARRQYERLSAAERRERERADRAAARAVPPPADPEAEAGDDGAAPSARAATAVAAAREAVGRPYAWGQAGPGSFDCSGLIQWAYARAGVALPRTSQAQARAGRRVALSDARPGDIVVYRKDASHVGMYVGGGQIVHAPYPGAQVRYEAVGVMPVSSVVRP